MPEWVLGIDVGGTRTKMGLVRLPEGAVVASRIFATEKKAQCSCVLE